MNIRDGRRLIVKVYPDKITMQLVVNNRLRKIPLTKQVTITSIRHAIALIAQMYQSPEHQHTAISISPAGHNADWPEHAADAHSRRHERTRDKIDYDGENR